jgi:hypothetical protein
MKPEGIATLLDRIAVATSGGLYNIDKSEIFSLYKEVFGVELCNNCSSDLISAYNSLRKYAKQIQI